VAFNPKTATAMFCRAWERSRDLEHSLEVFYAWAKRSSARERLAVPVNHWKAAAKAAKRAGMKLRELRNCKYRDRETTQRKAIAVKELRGAGMSYPDIGKVLGMHHSTAIYLAKRTGATP